MSCYELLACEKPNMSLALKKLLCRELRLARSSPE